MSTAESRPAACALDAIPIKVAGLSKRYGARPALGGLSLTVGRGEIVGLLGSNGGGKTTTLRILAGLLPPDSGSGTVLGHDLERERAAIRCCVGYLAQRFSLYTSLSVRANLRFRADVFGVAQPRAAVAAVVAAFGLESIEKLTLEQISGGQARLVQLACAVVHAPNLLLLDEPTAGLDAVARQSVWRQMTRLSSQGVAVVLSTHELADASRCHKMVWLKEGAARNCGTPSDLARQVPACVFLVRGANLVSLIEPLQALAGVIGCYPSGADLRIVVAPGSASVIRRHPLLRVCTVESAAPTLEDAVLEWSAQVGWQT
jgi:ABC-2 type transport system ATP-binding protein